MKLSELLRYLIYDTQEKEVALNKEIMNIRNYIALEKIRFGSGIDVSFHNFGDLSGTIIAPLLILPVIENSFKHSTKNETEKAWVTIEISMINATFSAKVENSISENDISKKNTKSSDGMGLSNLRRRLELLYPEKHDLKIVMTDDSFLVVLNIDMS
jgi:LytS/YehU family sensor histidine kinase